MHRIDFVWRWVNARGLYLKHKDLRPEEIVALYGLEPVLEGDTWEMREKERAPCGSSSSPHRGPLLLVA
jgi:hypothetical protein